jgi:hypothetical protein
VKLKRIGIISAALLVLIFLVLLISFSSSPSPTAPKFVPVRSQPAGPYASTSYDWSGVVPVRDGKVWITADSGGTNRHIQQFLYDLDRRLVIGELLYARPIFFNRDQSRLLCEGYGSPADSIKAKVLTWLKKFRLGKPLAQRVKRDEAFWVLDLKDNSTIRIGEFSQFAGLGSSFMPSPDFRYGYNKPSSSFGGPELFLCDLQSNRFTKIRIDGEPRGWWDEQTILFKDPLNNFGLYEVPWGRTRTVFSAATIARALEELDLPGDAAALTAFCHWNGQDYDIYFTQAHEKSWGESFLLKADRAEPSLKLLYRTFKFEWLGNLDADGTHYLYQGEKGLPGKGGNGGVYLRDLASNTTRTIIEPDNGGQYALCRFYGDSIIYWRKKLLWRVDLNGSNNVPLLPIPGK